MDIKEIKSKNEYYDKISEKRFPIYAKDKTMFGLNQVNNLKNAF